MKKQLLLILVAFVGCTVEQADRCSEGFVWDPEVLACRLVEIDTEPDAGPDTDSGDTDTDTNMELGIGELCWSDADCATFIASYCQLSPFNPDDPGFCTIKDCLAGQCPTGYLCCDCSSLGSQVTCLTEESAESAEQYGCTCG